MLVHIGVNFLLQHIFLVLSNPVFKLSAGFSHIDGVTLTAINPVDNTWFISGCSFVLHLTQLAPKRPTRFMAQLQVVLFQYPSRPLRCSLNVRGTDATCSWVCGISVIDWILIINLADDVPSNSFNSVGRISVCLERFSDRLHFLNAILFITYRLRPGN